MPFAFSPQRGQPTDDEQRRVRRFFEALADAIQQFAQQKIDKCLSQQQDHLEDSLDEVATMDYADRASNAFLDTRRHDSYFSTLPHLRVFALLTDPLSSKDVAILWRLHQKGVVNIRQAFAQTYGGHAVGNGLRFLLSHLMPFYVLTNVLAACDYHNQPDKWGPHLFCPTATKGVSICVPDCSKTIVISFALFRLGNMF